MKHILLLMTLIALAPVVKAAYQETMDPNGLTKNLQTDFGMADDVGCIRRDGKRAAGK